MSSVTAKQILKQVEFYFSDSNITRDKFLKEIVSKSEEGWCPIDTIASFQRMKNITEDLSVVVAALKESKCLTVSEDDKNLRRNDPVPEGKIDSTDRSVYMKGFPEDASLESVQEFVEKHLAEGDKLLCTRLRRFKGGDNDKSFKGSVFLELNNAEAAGRLVAKADLKFTEASEAMDVQMKSDYFAKKKSEIAAKKGKTSGGDQGKGTKRKAQEEEKEKEIVKDLIVSITSLGADGSREDLKACVEAAGGKVTYVEYARGQDSGFIRLSEEAMKATELCKKLNDANTEVAGEKATFAALEGEAEADYWVKVRENQKNKRTKVRGSRDRR